MITWRARAYKQCEAASSAVYLTNQVKSGTRRSPGVDGPWPPVQRRPSSAQPGMGLDDPERGPLAPEVPGTPRCQASQNAVRGYGQTASTAPQLRRQGTATQ